MPLNGLLHLQYAQHVSGISMPIIRSSRLYVCYYHLWCAVLGCWLSGAGQQAMCPARGMLHDSAWLLVDGHQVQDSRLCVRQEGCCMTAVVQHPSFWTHSLLPCTWRPTTSNKALHTIGGNNTHIVSSSWWWA